VFAGWTSAQFPGWHWPALAVVILLIYFYSHYAFASLTTHFLSMYVPFLGILLAAGAPPPLMAYSMAFYTNLSASLTHYGTTQAPMVFSAGYVSHGLWWKVGLVMSFVNLFIWTSLGLVWWKFLGLW
ncbi:MAG: anion permease, partial [Acidobacteria bacterium]|nr:anion permease [Acidobacteriota bacterium]